MKTLSLETLFQQDEMGPDEYLNPENTLIYCKQCHTPRQKRFEIGGTLFEPRCMCDCQAEAYEQREKERKHREFLDKVARNRSVGLPDPELRQHIFENDLGYNPRQIHMAKRYVENWEEFRKTATGLLLWGDVGTGKSFLAGCIANALLDKGVPVMMTNFTRLLNKLTDMYGGDRNGYIDSLKAYPLLIIDDLGVERNSDFAREQVYNIIDSRYRSQLPMIVTTNLTVDEMKKTEDLARARIYDRILERCTAIRFSGQNIRKQNMAANLARAKGLLEEVSA